MSWQVVDAVLKHSRSKGPYRLLLFCIAHHAAPDGTGARVALPLLEQETGIDRRDIQRYAKALCEMGELEKHSGTGRVASSYTILLPLPREKIHGEIPMGEDPQETHHGETPMGSIESHGNLPMSPMGASPPVQQTAVETTVVARNKQTTDTTSDTASVLAQLEAEGIAESVAAELVRNVKYCQRIPQQLVYLEAREPKDRAATLVASIKGDWSAPKAHLERQQARQRQCLERERREQEATAQAAAKRAEQERLAQTAAEAATLDAHYASLGEEERAAVDAEVLGRLGPIGRRANAKGALEAMRRQVLREMLAPC